MFLTWALTVYPFQFVQASLLFGFGSKRSEIYTFYRHVCSAGWKVFGDKWLRTRFVT